MRARPGGALGDRPRRVGGRSAWPQPPQDSAAGVPRRASKSCRSTSPSSTARSHYVTDLEQDDFTVFEDGAKQELTYFNRTNLPIALSLLIDSSASMEQRMENAQEAAIGFAQKHPPAGPGAGRRLRQPRRDSCRRSPDKVDDLESGHSRHLVGRLDRAAQRRLHRAEGARQGQGEEPRGGPAPGHRRAVGRRGHAEPGQLRGSAGAGEAVRDGDLHHRPAAARDRPR